MVAELATSGRCMTPGRCSTRPRSSWMARPSLARRQMTLPSRASRRPFTASGICCATAKDGQRLQPLKMRIPAWKSAGMPWEAAVPSRPPSSPVALIPVDRSHRAVLGNLGQLYRMTCRRLTVTSRMTTAHSTTDRSTGFSPVSTRNAAPG